MELRLSCINPSICPIKFPICPEDTQVMHVVIKIKAILQIALYSLLAFKVLNLTTMTQLCFKLSKDTHILLSQMDHG